MRNEPELAPKWKHFAEEQCRTAGLRLTSARLAVYSELVDCGHALTAYELLARQEKRSEKKIAPLTVYRHLDFLIRAGLVHRLESTHRYIACAHPNHAHESQYLLCTSCGHADELESSNVEEILADLAKQRGFQPAKTTIELTGLCQDCARDSA